MTCRRMQEVHEVIRSILTLSDSDDPKVQRAVKLTPYNLNAERARTAVLNDEARLLRQHSGKIVEE